MAKITPYQQDVLHVCETDLPWEQFSGSKILVTGATGLIGGCMVDVLMSRPQQSYHVYALGRNEQRARQRFSAYWGNGTFHFLKADISQPLKEEEDFDYIIHAASNASPNFFRERPVEVIKANILGMINLTEYGLCHHMKRMLYVSSGEIYGDGQGAYRETDSGYIDCATARACYPSSKRAAETLAVSYAKEYGTDVVIARPCHTYGPFFTESDNRVYAQFIRNVLRCEDIVMKSRGEQFRSWIYVVDCVSAILHILLKGERLNAYNIADSHSNITIRQLAELTAKAANCQVVFDISDDGSNTIPIHQATFQTDKLQSLGWQPTLGIEEALSHTIDTLR